MRTFLIYYDNCYVNKELEVNMSQLSFNLYLACKLPSLGSISQDGIFSSFKGLERFGRRLVRGKNKDKFMRTMLEIIPVRTQTECPYRMTRKCTINCKCAVSAIQHGPSIHIVNSKTI
jgi:hypothetical protein